MAESYPMNRLDTIVNGLQEMIPIAEERSPMMRDGKRVEVIQKLDQARRCIDKLDNMIDLKDASVRPEQPWERSMRDMEARLGEKFGADINRLSQEIEQLKQSRNEQQFASAMVAGNQARVEAKVDKLIRMQGYDPANFINGPEIMNNITGTPQDSPPPKRKRGRPKKGEEVHKKPDITPEYIANVVTEVLQQKGLFPTYPPQMPYMYPQMFYPPQQGYMPQPMYNPYTGAPMQQPAQFNQQFYPYPQAQPVPQESIKPDTTCSGVTPKNPNKNELDRYDLNVDYYAPPEELLQEAPKRAKKKNDKPSTPQQEDIIIPEPIAPIVSQPIQNDELESKPVHSSKDKDHKDKPQGGTPISKDEPTAPEEPQQVDETVNLFRGDATVEAYIDNPIDRTEVRVDSYDQFYNVAKHDLLGAAYTLIESNGDEQCLKHVRNMMNAYHKVSKEVEVWHKFSSKDKKQILKAYSVTLKKFSSMKYDDKYPGFEEIFKLINYWFQRRFPIGTKNNFRYNPSCIPGWVEDIIMVMGNYVNTMWWKDKVEEFKRWCDGCQDKRCHYALPPTLMDEVRMQKIKANRNLIVWDIMNEVGFFKYLNSMLPDNVTTSYYDIVSWVWPQYALRYKLDCQDPKDEDFDVDDCSDPNLPAMMYAKIERYTPGYSFTESNLSNFGWVPRETPKAQNGMDKFLSPLTSSAFKLYRTFKSRIVTKKYRGIQNAVQACYA